MFGGEVKRMLKENGKFIRKTINNTVKKIASIKANANCLGFMYEPKKPEIMKRS